MIAAINFEEKLALLENGQQVPIAFYNEDKEEISDHEDAHSLMAGPYFEWNGARYDRKFVHVEMDAISLLTPGASN